MTFIFTEIDKVLSSGTAVQGHADSAGSLAWQYLRSLENATDWVKHPAVIAAIERYHGTWQPRVNEVADKIEALGSNTRASATTIGQADDDSNHTMRQQAVVSTTTSTAMSRDINAP